MSGPKTLWWVRHGPTHAKTMVGWTDLPCDLSQTDQIARLSAYLPAAAPVISSDLIRACATADAIAGNRPRFAPRPGLREMHFGAWENRHYADIATTEPEQIRAFWDCPGTTTAPGGECWHDLVARVHAEVDTLGALPGPDLIVVAHFGVILTQIERALGLSTVEVFGHKIDNLSVTRLVRNRAGWTANPINHIP